MKKNNGTLALPGALWISLCTALAAALFLTGMRPHWIEAIFGVDPDGGSGLTEFLIVLSVLLTGLAVGTYLRRRSRPRPLR